MLKFLKKLFHIGQTKHKFWLGHLDAMQLDSIFAACMKHGNEIVSHKITTSIIGYKIIVYTQKKQEVERRTRDELSEM